MATRGRGRPRSAEDPERAALDEAIARTAQRLIAWGLTTSRAHQITATALQQIKRVRIGETRTATLEHIGKERVRQIHEAWQAAHWRRQNYSRYTLESRQQGRPWSDLGQRMQDVELAGALLANGGIWPADVDLQRAMPLGHVTPELKKQPALELAKAPIRIKRGN